MLSQLCQVIIVLAQKPRTTISMEEPPRPRVRPLVIIMRPIRVFHLTTMLGEDRIPDLNLMYPPWYSNMRISFSKYFQIFAVANPCLHPLQPQSTKSQSYQPATVVSTSLKEWAVTRKNVEELNPLIMLLHHYEIVSPMFLVTQNCLKSKHLGKFLAYHTSIHIYEW